MTPGPVARSLPTANVLHELRIKRVQLNNALLLAHGLSFTATLDASSDPLFTSKATARVDRRQLRTEETIRCFFFPGVYSAAASRALLPPHASRSTDIEDCTALRLRGHPSFLLASQVSNNPSTTYPIRCFATHHATSSPLIVSQTIDDQGLQLFACRQRSPNEGRIYRRKSADRGPALPCGSLTQACNCDRYEEELSSDFQCHSIHERCPPDDQGAAQAGRLILKLHRMEGVRRWYYQGTLS